MPKTPPSAWVLIGYIIGWFFAFGVVDVKWCQAWQNQNRVACEVSAAPVVATVWPFAAGIWGGIELARWVFTEDQS